jgi:CheY-like chemotaxis protein
MEVSAARVLVVDDNRHVRKIVRTVLQGFVAETLEADGGVAGLRVWSELRPDLVIVDYEMPRVNGALVSKVIRDQERSRERRTAVLMMTAHGDKRHVTEARAADVDGLIAKPLTARLILERTICALENAQQVLLAEQHLARRRHLSPAI